MVDDARILIAQHARTAQLMGVDFLPLGTIPESLGESLGESLVRGQTPQRASAQAGEPVSEASAPEPKAPSPVAVGGLRAGAETEGDTSARPIESAVLQASYAQAQGQQAQLEALRAKYEQESPHRHFGHSHTNIVFGEGDPNADLMFVGEAPGEEEDRTGRPFVGRAGQLLEKMIVAMGFSRASVYICNVLKVRPDGNATPTDFERTLCGPYVYEQIRIVKPKVIVTLGLPASQLLLGSNKPMRSLRGHWHVLGTPEGIKEGTIGGEDFAALEVMPTYHPAYLLRSYTKENRQAVWSDLQQAVKRLEGQA